MCLHILLTYICLHVYIQICTYYVYIYTYTYIYILYVSMHIHIYIYTHTYFCGVLFVFAGVCLYLDIEKFVQYLHISRMVLKCSSRRSMHPK